MVLTVAMEERNLLLALGAAVFLVVTAILMPLNAKEN